MTTQMNKDLYKQLCEKEATIPIFSRDWWLDAVCGIDQWDVALVEENGEIVGSLPYYYVVRRGKTHIKMPLLTQTMGPWLKYPDKDKSSLKLSFEIKTLKNLIDQLPGYLSFAQNFNYSISNWLPFFWKGFKQTTKYTYVIEDISDPEKVFNNFKKEAKKKIRKAEKMVSFYSSNDIEEFYRINQMSFARQNLKPLYDFALVKRIDDACQSHQAREILIAKDAQDRVHCAIYLIWDPCSIYLLMSGGDPELRSSGAQSLLIWEAIKRLRSKSQRFDFEGSMVERIESYNRSFNPVQKPYFQVYRELPKLYYTKQKIKKILNYSGR